MSVATLCLAVLHLLPLPLQKFNKGMEDCYDMQNTAVCVVGQFHAALLSHLSVLYAETLQSLAGASLPARTDPVGV